MSTPYVGDACIGGKGIQPMARADTINAPRGGKRIAARARAAIGYVRRSTDRQEQSIPDQKKAIEKYVDDHDLRLLRAGGWKAPS